MLIHRFTSQNKSRRYDGQTGVHSTIYDASFVGMFPPNGKNNWKLYLGVLLLWFVKCHEANWKYTYVYPQETSIGSVPITETKSILQIIVI